MVRGKRARWITGIPPLPPPLHNLTTLFLVSLSTEKDFSSLRVLGTSNSQFGLLLLLLLPSFGAGACLLWCRAGRGIKTKQHFFWSLRPKRVPSPGLSLKIGSFFWNFFCLHLLCSSGIWATWVTVGKYVRKKINQESYHHHIHLTSRFLFVLFFFFNFEFWFSSQFFCYCLLFRVLRLLLYVFCPEFFFIISGRDKCSILIPS